MPRTNPPEAQAIARVLREMRAWRELTTTEVAAIIGCAQQTYSHWENGRRAPAIWDIPRLAAAYRVSPTALARDLLDAIRSG